MPLSTGSSIGPYEVVGWLGAGGMGEVYRARDSRLDRDVAIKLLHERFARDATRLFRFEQEARAAARLNHPNILSVYDVGNQSGSPFVVSELLEGETLRARLKRGAITLVRAVEHVRQLAEGLAAAHDKGIVHRDVKPENLFITNDGRIKILDFGVAKLVGPDPSDAPSGTTTETEPGAILGTSAYMSPEQIRSEDVDARSDIFSVGAVLYELLAGRPAFGRATAAETMAAVLKDDVAPPVAVPAALWAIVGRCLEKGREARFQSARDLAFAIQQASITPRPTLTRARQPRDGLLLGVALAAAAVAIAAWLPRRSVSSFEDRFARARFTRFTEWEGTEGHGVISPDGKFVGFVADRDGQFDVWVSQINTGHFQNLTSGSMRLSAPGPPIRTLGFMGDGSGLWLQTGNRTHVVPLLGGQTRPFLAPENTGASWTRDGSRLAYFKVSNGDRLFVADRSGANAREIFVRAEPGIHTHNPVWSPDAQWIYFVHGKSVGPSFEMDIWRIRPSGEAPEQVTEVKTGLDYLAPIGDRTVLYVAQAADGTGPWLWALDVPTRQTRRLVSGLDQYRTVTVSNDERRIVTTIANPTTSLSIFPLTDRIAEERDIRPHPQVAVPARMPRFGRTSLFYSSNYGPGEGLWRLKDGRAVEIWKGSDGRLVEPPAVSPDESRLVVTITSNGKPQLSIMSSEGTDVRTLNSTLVPEGMADWSPDGTWIVVGGTHEGAPGLFRLSPDGMLMRIFSGRALNPIWSPDGNLIIFNGPIVTGMSTLQAVRPDGTPASIPSLKVRPGGQRFLRDGRGVVFQGERLDFEVLDLASGRTRSLTHFAGSPLMSARRFDISPDGTQIVFDRSRENADIVLIELPE